MRRFILLIAFLFFPLFRSFSLLLFCFASSAVVVLLRIHCRLHLHLSPSSQPLPVDTFYSSLLFSSLVCLFILTRDINTVLSIRCTWNQVLSGLTRVELPRLLSLASPHQFLPVAETNNKKPFSLFNRSGRVKY